MVRTSIIFVACAVLLAGCGDRKPAYLLKMSGGLSAPENVPTPEMPASPAPAQQFSYTHSWSVVMAHGTVSPRFLRARDLCLQDRTLNCKLVSANITSGGDEQSSVSASLEVQLPHAKLDVFEHALLAPAKGEGASGAVMQSRSTQAQSVETQAGDTARRVAQLTAYRDRLAAIAARSNLSVDDMIKLEAERARVQTDLDDATGQQRTLTGNIAREDVTISLTERTEPVSAASHFFNDAGDTLADSATAALLFVIGVIPWLPIVVFAVWLVSWLWHWFQRRRAARKAVVTAPG